MNSFEEENKKLKQEIDILKFHMTPKDLMIEEFASLFNESAFHNYYEVTLKKDVKRLKPFYKGLVVLKKDTIINLIEKVKVLRK